MVKSNTRTLRLIAIILPPLLLGAAGLFHPHQLTTDSAGRWTLIHIILLPLFALLGVSYYLFLSRYKGWPIRLAKICTGIYVVFYPALDAIAGIANGVVVSRLVNTPDSPQRTELIGVLRQSLYTMGNHIGSVGIYALLGISFFTYIYIVENKPDFKTALFLTGFIIGTGLFAFSHLYAPWGIVAMLLLSLSMLAVEVTENKS